MKSMIAAVALAVSAVLCPEDHDLLGQVRARTVKAGGWTQRDSEWFRSAYDARRAQRPVRREDVQAPRGTPRAPEAPRP